MKELDWIYKQTLPEPEELGKVQAVFDDRMDWSRPFEYDDLLWQAQNCYLLGVMHGKQQERARRKGRGR